MSVFVQLRSTPSVQSSVRPNVLVILTDDQRARGTLRVMPKTRKFLKQRGQTFSNAFATTPMCCPSRASIFTGQYAHNHGIHLSVSKNPGFDQRSTLQHQLQKASYKTAIFGKYLNGWNLSQDPPFFDSWAIFGNTSKAGYYGGRWNVDGEKRKVKKYSTTFIQERGVEFIRKHSSPKEPWALFLSTAAPHSPFTPEPQFKEADVSRRRSVDTPSDRRARTKPRFIRNTRRSAGEAADERAGQLRTLMSVDVLVGEIDRTLRETGQSRETLVIFMSDNGFMWGEHGLTRKMLPYDGSVRIPLLVRWPGEVEEGGRDDRLAANIDVAPTIYEATGVAPPRRSRLDGRSLLGDWDRDRLLLEYWRAHGKPSWSALRSQRTLYVEYYRRNGIEVKGRELYDRATDLRERINLLNDLKRVPDKRVERLSRLLSNARKCAGGSCP